MTDPKEGSHGASNEPCEMEDRYRKMAKLGVRAQHRRLQPAGRRRRDKGWRGHAGYQTGFEKGHGRADFRGTGDRPVADAYIVVIVDGWRPDDEKVAGRRSKARSAPSPDGALHSIHLIMATRRPSVDVITGTIRRTSRPASPSGPRDRQPTSFSANRAPEQLLGQGDIPHHGRRRAHRAACTAFVRRRVEQVIGASEDAGPSGISGTVTAGEDEEEPEVDGGAVFDKRAPWVRKMATTCLRAVKGGDARQGSAPPLYSAPPPVKCGYTAPPLAGSNAWKRKGLSVRRTMSKASARSWWASATMPIRAASTDPRHAARNNRPGSLHRCRPNCFRAFRSRTGSV